MVLGKSQDACFLNTKKVSILSVQKHALLDFSSTIMQRFFSQRYFFRALQRAPEVERLFFHEKFPVLGTLIFPGFSPVCRDFENFHKVPLCVGTVLWCGDFENFHKVPLCVSIVLCVVEILKFFIKVPLCVGFAVWCGT